MITKEYCRCTVRVEKKGLRRAATLKAAQLLGSIVQEGTVELTRAAVDATKSKVSRAFQVVTRWRGYVETSGASSQNLYRADQPRPLMPPLIGQ